MARPKRARASSKRSNDSGGRRSSKSLPDQDTSNEGIYSESDAYLAEKTKLTLDSDSESSDGEPADESVFNLDVASSGEEEDSEEDSEDDLLDQLPEHLRRAAKRAAAGEAPDDSDSSSDEQGGQKRSSSAANWGKSKKAYYDADTADLEIGQEFAEAEEEEAAALELQKASYSRLTAADFDDDAVSSSSDSDSDADTASTSATAAAAASAGADSDSLGARLQQQEEQEQSTSSSSSKKKAKKSPTVESHSADAAGLRGELEALLSGRAAADVSSGPTDSTAAVEVATVRRDLSKLSRKDKLALVAGDSPELPGLCASLHAVLEELCEKIDPLAQEVTADLGASDDGLLYLQAKRQLLLGMAMNTCFYMVLKAGGHSGVKHHPVMERLLQFQQLTQQLQSVDAELAPQVDLLVRALSAGIDLARTSDGEESDNDTNNAVHNSSHLTNGKNNGDSGEDSDSSSSSDEGYVAADDSELDAEEERYMEGLEEAEEEAKQAAKAAAKAEKRRAKTPSATVANGRPLSKKQQRSANAFSDYGDIEVAGTGSTSKNNPLQSLMNSIQQKERAAAKAGARRGDTSGDAEVDGQTRGDIQRAAQRRPAPGGADSDDDDAAMDALFGSIPQAALDHFANEDSSSNKRGKKRARSDAPQEQEGSDDEFLAKVTAQKERKREIKAAKYSPAPRIAGTLEEELAAERQRKGTTARGVSYEIIKNRGLTPHKSKLNRNPRVKKREAYRKAVIRRKGQVVDVRTNEAGRYAGEGTGIRSTITRSRKLAS